MEIWLAKKANPPLATRLWHCVVWGSVSALALTALVDMFAAIPLIPVFWIVMALNLMLTVAVKSLDKSAWLGMSALSVLVMLFAYVIFHGGDAMSLPALQLNIPMLAYVGWALLRCKQLRAGTN